MLWKWQRGINLIFMCFPEKKQNNIGVHLTGQFYFLKDRHIDFIPLIKSLLFAKINVICFTNLMFIGFKPTLWGRSCYLHFSWKNWCAENLSKLFILPIYVEAVLWSKIYLTLIPQVMFSHFDLKLFYIDHVYQNNHSFTI
jgi:hypothetical protein